MTIKERIRNFCVIAHIDHGKSTLSDKIMEICKVPIKKGEGPTLDSMELEKERGITIKSQTVRLNYKYNNIDYILNLQDTPGHVDFSYEVHRVLFSCQGSILLVDATQGIQSQTIYNLEKALSANHVIIPVITKIDLPNADIEGVKMQIFDLLGKEVECFPVSAKTGEGVEDVIKEIIKQIPSPQGDENAPLQALIIDSWYNEYLGISVLFCIKNGTLKKDDTIFMMSEPSRTLKVAKLGVFNPKPIDVQELSVGEIGFISTFSKEIIFNVGDTLTSIRNPSLAPLPGFSKSRCSVYCFFLLHENGLYDKVKKAMAKLQLNDASFFFEHENVEGWGIGFKCGFLGILHMEIIQERLLREFDIDVIITSPSVQYSFEKDGDVKILNSANMFPDRSEIKKGIIKEPIALCKLICPAEHKGAVINLCIEHRGVEENQDYIGSNVILTFKIPLNEMITNFQDELYSRTRGYGSCNYEIIGFEPSDLVRLDILLNKTPINILSTVVHRDKAYKKSVLICKHLKEVLPRQQFSQAIQAVMEGKVIVREDITAYKKDVLAKCSGGDVSRKNKLLDKQKKGKSKMKAIAQGVKIKNSDLINLMKLKSPGS